MSGRRRNKIKIDPEILGPESKMERNTRMFRDWVNGLTHADLAKKYSMGTDNVKRISMAQNWKQLKKDLRERAYSRAVDRMKETTIKMFLLMDADIESLVEEVLNGKEATAGRRRLTKEERDHIRSLLDRYLRETRLEDGKPTEVLSGSVKTHLILPPGNKRFGIIPPDPKVLITESPPPEDSQDTVDLDQLDEDI